MNNKKNAKQVVLVTDFIFSTQSKLDQNPGHISFKVTKIINAITIPNPVNDTFLLSAQEADRE